MSPQEDQASQAEETRQRHRARCRLQEEERAQSEEHTHGQQPVPGPSTTTFGNVTNFARAPPTRRELTLADGSENIRPRGGASRSQAVEQLTDLSPAVNARSRAQRERRERERQQRQSTVATVDTRNRRSEGQQRRRQREREQQAQAAGAQLLTPAPPLLNDPHQDQAPAVPNRRSLAQRERWRREREARTAQTPYPTPPATAPDPRSAGQRRRREQERDSREGSQRRLGSSVQSTNGEDFRDGPGNGEMSRRTQAGPTLLLADGSRIPLLSAACQPYHEPAERHDLGRMDLECPYCQALHWKSERLSNSSISNPKFGTCCDSGQVRLPLLEPPPGPLLDLYSGEHAQAKEFRENLWQYNRAFAFTSMLAHQDHTVNSRGRGEPVFRILGELYQRLSPLQPVHGHVPRYSQLYIYDPRDALEYRRQNNAQLNPDTLELIQGALLQNHQYTAVFKHAFEVMQTHANHQPPQEVAIRLRLTPGLDRRRYNTPTADEVAVIICDSNGEVPTPKRDIVLNLRNGGFRIISDLHPAYAPLAYALLFPHGENGWHPELRMHQPGREDPRRLSQSRFVAYRLQVRRDEFSTVLRSKRLLQRFLVDMYATIDQNRLSFLRHNQPKLRASLYSGLEDALTAAGNDFDLNTLGQRLILPSSYIGGHRHMQQRYQDSMAIARHFGRVDLFGTVTANPRWPEIERELLPGQTAYDRPDLVSRVFQLKKKAIIDYIYKNGIFGHAVAYVYTIEFQKRGLPHMHIIIILREPLSSPDIINNCIRAEWPDHEQEPLLFDTVKRLMVHGPCGVANPSAPCMDEHGKCTKGYPKHFSDYTTMDQNGFPVYERKEDGRVHMVGRIPVDNRWIVPYCPLLSALFDCHINLEVVVTGSSLKYLFKYIQKGGDMAMVETELDEIKNYTGGRYISAPEAVHRIFHFDMHDQTPNVVRLQIHLPGQHMVVFDPSEDPQIMMQRASNEKTTLTAYFQANANQGALGEEARKYTYAEFPQHFTWKENGKVWAVRKQGFAIGRMYFVPPTAGERFYLRNLLTIVKGATSFENLRTFGGVVHPTFRDACLARGLLEDDGEWRQCLQEASNMQTGWKLRRPFATILIFCEPSKPEELWAEFRPFFCDDLSRRVAAFRGGFIPSEDDVFDYGLYLLDQILRNEGRNLADWPSMPRPVQNWAEERVNPLLAEQLGYDADEQRRLLHERLPQLNAAQRRAYDSIIPSIEQGNGRLFFVNGPGGTGKTFLYNVICNKVRSEGLIVLCVASSGIAALLLPGGRTSHFMFKIPIDNLSDISTCSISKQSLRADLLRRAKAIIWDEVGAQHRHAIETVDRTLQDIRDDGRPFGGISVVFGGDFQQTLPVIPNGSREEIIEATLLKSTLWEKVEVHHLTENMRVRGDPNAIEFANWLLDIGHGRNVDRGQQGKVEIPEDMRVSSFSGLTDFIYSNVESSPPPPPSYFLDRMILAPRNSDVAGVNDSILDKMTGSSTTYYSIDEVLSDNHTEPPPPIPPEHLRALNLNTLPPGELHVKIGCPVILLRNLSSAQGLCNGTRLVVTRASQRVIEARILGGDHDGETALIPRITLIPQERGAELPFRIKRRQFPVRLAFALTINRAQGQSVKWVGLDLRVPVFGHGQLYVALSRATSPSRVKILTPNEGSDTGVLNVVYPEVLLD